jgi:hypothetical protein
VILIFFQIFRLGVRWQRLNKMNKRVDMKAILRNPSQLRSLMVQSIITLQAREGINTTFEQACVAYDKIYAETFKRIKKESEKIK